MLVQPFHFDKLVSQANISFTYHIVLFSAHIYVGVTLVFPATMCSLCCTSRYFALVMPYVAQYTAARRGPSTWSRRSRGRRTRSAREACSSSFSAFCCMHGFDQHDVAVVLGFTSPRSVVCGTHGCIWHTRLHPRQRSAVLCVSKRCEQFLYLTDFNFVFWRLLFLFCFPPFPLHSGSIP